jgi:hypothetical protein
MRRSFAAYAAVQFMKERLEHRIEDGQALAF